MKTGTPERLEDVHGVDWQTADHLRMAGYTSVAARKQASRWDIEQVRGIDRNQAAVIHAALLGYNSGGSRRGGTTRRTALGAVAGAIVLGCGNVAAFSAIDSLTDELPETGGESTAEQTETPDEHDGGDADVRHTGQPARRRQ